MNIATLFIKPKNLDLAIPLLGIYPRELIICVLTKTYE